MRFTVQALEEGMCRWRPTCSADQAARRRLARAVQLEALCRRRVRCGRIRRLCPRVLLRGRRGVSRPVPRRRTRDRAVPVEPEGVRAAECRAWDCEGVDERTRHAKPNGVLKRPTSPPPSASAADRSAWSTCWRGASGLARPSPTAGGSPGRVGSRGSSRPSPA